MTLGGLLLVVLIVAAHAVFFARVYFIFRCIRLGQGSLPAAHPLLRMKDVLVKGFGQVLVLRQPAGIGHFLIFWGFFVLTYGTLEGLILGVFPGFSFAWMGPIYWLMNTLQDWFGLLVMGALAVALYRRFVWRPRRLQANLAHTIDALIIIVLIAVLIKAFYAMRIIEPKPGFTPVTDMLRPWFVSVTGKAAHPVGYAAFHWLHNVVVLSFLVYIPFSKHLHLITALPNLYFRDEKRIAGRIPKLDLEAEGAESFGISKITEYSRKDLLDVTACTECGRCQEACPAYFTNKPLSPKEVVLGLKAHLFEEGPALLRDRTAEPKKALYPDVIEKDVLWACTTCRACEEACPVEILPMSKLIGIRQARVLMEGDFAEEAQTALRNVETQSNPWGLPQEARGAWAGALGVKTLAEDANVDYLFFVGCAGSYDQRYMQVTRAVARLMQEAGVSFGILGAEECCTGDSAKRIGNEYLAQMLAQQNVDTMNGYGVKKVVTACPHCYNTIKNEFPDYGGNFEVVHHTELLAALMQQGKLKPKQGPATVVYHDSCYLGRYNGVFDAPRAAILASGTLKELLRTRSNSFCCGAGGGRMWMEERIGGRINEERSKEIIQVKPEVVATACPFCMTMVSDGLKSEHRADIPVKDVAEVLAEACGIVEKEVVEGE